MKILLITSLLLVSSSSVAAECVTNAHGRTICRGAGGAVVATQPHAPVVVAPRAVTTGQAYPGGVVTAHNGVGGTAAYNPRTGNAAVSQKNLNGVTTTETARGGEAKTKNGMGVAQGPGGTTCAKGRGAARCN